MTANNHWGIRNKTDKQVLIRKGNDVVVKWKPKEGRKLPIVKPGKPLRTNPLPAHYSERCLVHRSRGKLTY